MDCIASGIGHSMKQAVIDIGTNTCLLLIAESDHVGEIKVIRDVHNIARLGAGVDRTKLIQAESYERLKNILLGCQKILDENNVEVTAVIATSAMRDAENKEEIARKIKSDCGFDVEILSGEDESIWSFRGAVCGLQSNELRGTVATLDIGGGSTELSIGENGIYLYGRSINIGAVRIKERFLSPSSDESSIKSARDFIQTALRNTFANIKTHRLIAVAGTPTALAAMKLKLLTFDAKKVNGTILSSEDVKLMTEEILSLSAEQLIRKYPAVHPSRADILPAGALILEEILWYLNLKEVRVSTYGLRYGIMIREFERMMGAKSGEWLITSE